MQICCAKEMHTFKSNILTHDGNQSNAYNNKYYNKYDYLQVWFIGCMCFFYNKAHFHITCLIYPFTSFTACPNEASLLNYQLILDIAHLVMHIV